ncbi:MAG: hypothetical protein JNK48_11495 [Bryobacterales bacterium]|nr:hypothetical protein [Bryobacterales bacterium]
MRLAAVLVSTGLVLRGAGPAEFGWAELRKAAEERGLAARYLPLEADVLSSLKPDGFEVQPGRVSGGDLRGLMYGLLEAAEQIRASGRIVKTRAAPVVLLRGVRLELGPEVFATEWFPSRTFWNAYFAGLAKARINRLKLEFTVAPFPYLLRLPLFDGVAVEGMTPYERGRNLDALKQIAGLAMEYAVDLAVGIRSFETPAAVTGLGGNRGLYLRSALETLLAEVHAIRAIAVEAPEEMREPVGAAVSAVGRLVTIESAGQAFHANWRRVEELAEREAMPPTAKLQGGPAGLRRVAGVRFADPQYARLVARCAGLGAMGVDVGVTLPITAPESRMAHFVWGRLLYDPEAADSVWRTNGLDDAMAAAARAYPRVAGESELQAVQRLHWNASQMERALHGQQASALADELRQVANRARYDGRLLWGEFLVANHGRTPHESFLRAALREFQAAKTYGEKLGLAVAELDRRIAALTQQLPQQEAVDAALPWQAPAARPSVLHRPLLQVDARKPLAVPLTIGSGSTVTGVTLRYRMLEGAGEFAAMEGSVRAPRWTIPASALESAGTLLYYFELRHAGGVWLYPDPAVEAPVFQTRIKVEGVTKQP